MLVPQIYLSVRPLGRSMMFRGKRVIIKFINETLVIIIGFCIALNCSFHLYFHLFILLSICLSNGDFALERLSFIVSGIIQQKMAVMLLRLKQKRNNDDGNYSKIPRVI